MVAGLTALFTEGATVIRATPIIPSHGPSRRSRSVTRATSVDHLAAAADALAAQAVRVVRLSHTQLRSIRHSIRSAKKWCG